MRAGPIRMPMRVNIRRHICLSFSQYLLVFYTRSYIVNTYSATEDLHFIPGHFCELGGAGTLLANNQRCRNAVPSRLKALSTLHRRICRLQMRSGPAATVRPPTVHQFITSHTHIGAIKQSISQSINQPVYSPFANIQ